MVTIVCLSVGFVFVFDCFMWLRVSVIMLISCCMGLCCCVLFGFVCLCVFVLLFFCFCLVFFFFQAEDGIRDLSL